MELHPLCSLFPRMSGYEFDCLKLDIKENGQRTPIIIHDGLVLDGGNRYAACAELGIEPDFMKYGGVDITAYVLSANLHRRHLTPGQSAAIVSCVQNWAKAQTAGKPKSGNVTGLDTVASRQAKSGASEKTQRNADKVAKADPELAKAVGRGETTLPKAVREITGKPKSGNVTGLDTVEHESPSDNDENEMLVDALKSTVDSLTEENDRLKNHLAAGTIPDDGKEEIIKRLEILTEDNRKLIILNNGWKSQNNSYIAENAALKKQCQLLQRKLKKYEAS